MRSNSTEWYLNLDRKWKKTDDSFLYYENDIIFEDNGFTYYRHKSHDGYVTYIKRRV